MIRRPPRSTQSRSSAASDVYKRQIVCGEHLSREGNGVMRTRRMNGIRDYYLRSLRRTKNETHARLNTQRKILAVMNAVWRDETEYSDHLVTGDGAKRPL